MSTVPCSHQTFRPAPSPATGDRASCPGAPGAPSPGRRSPGRAAGARRPGRERGVALILVLIFTVLLYALIADLVTTARTARMTGEGDALVDRMRNHMIFTMQDIETVLLEDMTSAGAEEGAEGGGEGGGALGGALPGGFGGGGAGGDTLTDDSAEEEEPEPSAVADGTQDSWFEPTSYAEEDITTYVWVEDENRKFNVLTLVSDDEEFARESKDRFARIVDELREGTEFDLTEADGDAIATALIEWMSSGSRNETLPRPPLKSDTEFERTDITLPLHLDEMLMLRNVDEDLMFDKVLDGRVIPGLESVFTCYTSQGWDPGDAQDRAQRAQEQAGESDGGPTDAPQVDDPVDDEADRPAQTVGQGILININTAPPAVLYGIAGRGIPDSVIERILRWRNEEVEEEEELSATEESYIGNVDEGDRVRRKMFTELSELDELEEWKNLSDEDAKSEFLSLLTTTSDTFSVHMASMFRKSEENRTFVIQRSRKVVMRLDNGDDGYLHPLLPLEERHGMRVQGVDFPDDTGDRFLMFDDMDAFSREERSWNPFFVEFYLSDDERERIFGY